MNESRVQIRSRAAIWRKLLCVWLVALMVAAPMTTLYAFAAPNTLDKVVDMAVDAGIDNFPPDWDEMSYFIQMYTEIDKDTGLLINDPTTADNRADKVPEKLAVYSALMNAFGSRNKYSQWKTKFDQFATIKYGMLVPNEQNGGKDLEKKFNAVISEYNNNVGSSAVNDVADKLFGTGSFDPENNFLSPAMDGVYYIVNTMFSVLSQLVIWLFLLQCGADCLYIAVDFSRKMLVPFKDNSGNLQGLYGDSGYQLPIISEEAEKAVYGGTTSGTGDTMQGRNKVLLYLKHRIPTIVLSAVYLIMVFGGWWPRFISIIASLVTSLFTYVLQFFGLM